MTMQTRHVSPTILRAAFAQGQIEVRISSGELAPIVAKSHHLENPAARGEPHCTHSQYVNYFDARGQRIVGVHRYLRPDGSIGASGKEDPKLLVVDQEVLIADSQAP